MGANSKIQWTHHTFQAWIGCEKISEGCRNCYASVSTPARVSASRGLPLWGGKAHRQITSESNWKQPERWNKAASNYPDECIDCGARLNMDAQVMIGNAHCPSQHDEAGKFDPSLPKCGGGVRRNVRPRVFCASLADIFEDYIGPNAEEAIKARARLLSLIEKTPNLIWLLLTKRPENVRSMVHEMGWLQNDAKEWPTNAWIGFTAENQTRFDERWAHAKLIPAPIIFTSIEPQIGFIVLPDDYLARGEKVWPFVGGESGSNARPFDIGWARSLVRQCKSASVPVFVKQLGSNPVVGMTTTQAREFLRIKGHANGKLLIDLKDKKGGDISEFPEDLRVREIPKCL